MFRHLVCCSCVCLSTIVYGQSGGIIGKHENAVKDAQALLEDYVTSQQDIPPTLVVAGKGVLNSVKSEKFLQKSRNFIYFRDESQGELQRFTAESQHSESFSSALPYWRQRIDDPSGAKFYREGVQRPLTAVGLIHAFDPADVSLKDAKVPAYPHAIDPYTLPIALRSVRLRSGALHPFLFEVLERFAVREANYDEDGRLTGTFAVSETTNRRLDITFDPRVGNRPTKVVFWEVRGGEDTANPNAENQPPREKIHERIDTHWMYVKLTNSRELWLPVCVRSISHTSKGMTETLSIMRWRDKELPFPFYEDPNWTLEVSEQMEIDWISDWQEFEAHGKNAMELVAALDGR